ncbi:hypothetical protein BHE74_00049974 [Ensete ventricosum]|nr:hypothetical protein GW17_00034602 [Ensete ventricosum]RWW44300.1 hypothetical protein BHE74_00049974 [Ensete ventricosum]
MARPWGQRPPIASPQGGDASHDKAVEGHCHLWARCPLACEVPPEGSGAYHRGSRPSVEVTTGPTMP